MYNSDLKAIYGCLGETISRQFHNVFWLEIKFGKLYLKQHNKVVLNERDFEKSRRFHVL